VARAQASAATAAARPARANRTPLIILGLMGLVLVLVGGWASVRLATAAQLAAIGTAVEIPGGHVLVNDVDHVAPDQLQAPLADGTHAVEVTPTVDADDALTVDPRDFVIEGVGIVGAIAPTRSEPSQLQVAGGGSADLRLIYALADESTELVLVLPGGARVNAEHADHPGDRPGEEN
jgi:hypothetical protein